ncbi:MAG: AAA family ATPase [Acholeplasmatales bacterium]|jgi:AAA+ ATPase superfamily predicted ATPase|nr:AAA family ATPase [Acholeplasmatales bacterium]
MKIIGREEEINKLKFLHNSNKPELAAVYGKIGVGKTFLIENFFNNKFFFNYTGSKNITNKQELERFSKELNIFIKLNNWDQAFNELKKIIQASNNNSKKVIFIDEISFLDKHKSGFLNSLEYFWNSFCISRKDILLIICSSATSWIINKVFNKTCGLYDKIASRICINEFNLSECDEYLKNIDIKYDMYSITKAYMVFGGIPYYYSLFNKEKLVEQNIDNLLFKEDAILKNEYLKITSSLLDNKDEYLKVIRAIATKNSGLTRNEIIEIIKYNSGGTLTKILSDLELNGFIRKYNSVSFTKKESVYQIIDNFTLFYYNFLETNVLKSRSPFLLDNNDSFLSSWKNYAYELICLKHVPQIKKALGIGGVSSCTYSFKNENTQIDLIIDRADNVINIFEIKFSLSQYNIDKSYDIELRNKLQTFIEATKTRKSLFLVFITTFGLKNSIYNDLVTKELTLEDLFV